MCKRLPDGPATFVSWEDAVDFCRKLTEQEHQSGRLPETWEYRLPTEAQWEYACRAGTTSRYSFGEEESELDHYAWFDENAWDQDEQYAHPVGRKQPNPWGLFDMHGNVWEWCRDWYADKLPGGRDPEVTRKGSYRVFRGGCWYFSAGFCRSANRSRGSPSFRGFRPGLPCGPSFVQSKRMPPSQPGKRSRERRSKWRSGRSPAISYRSEWRSGEVGGRYRPWSRLSRSR